MSKLEQIFPYSDPNIVFARAKKLFGRDVKIEYSTRKDKKYMLYDPNKRVWIHFGQLPYYDYTRHRDEIRRMRFQQRNHKWSTAPKYSPRFLSYFLLW